MIKNYSLQLQKQTSSMTFDEASSATISRLREHQSATPSRWRENAEWRMKNRSWLRYSQRIAMMMLDKMEGFQSPKGAGEPLP